MLKIQEKFDEFSKLFKDYGPDWDKIHDISAPKITFSDKTFTPLNVVKQRVEIEVSDVLARITTIMHFVNHASHSMEGELQFFLPPDAQISKVCLRLVLFFQKNALIIKQSKKNCLISSNF